MVADPLLVAPRRPFWRALGLFAVAFAVGFVASTVAVLIEMIAGVRSSALRNATGAPLQGALIAFELSMAALVLWRLPAMTGLNLRELGLRRPRGRDWRVFGYGVLGALGEHRPVAAARAPQPQ